MLAVSIPAIFLHVDYQPSVDVALSRTTLSVTLSDVALLCVAVAAIVAARRWGLAALRPGRWAWVIGVAFLGLILIQTVGRAGTEGYPFADHLVTAAKFAEYAVLAPAVPLLVRSRRDLELVLWVLVGWLVIAASVAVAQLAGADVFDAWKPWGRQPSFIGHHDLAALAAVGLCLAVAAILLRAAWPRPHRLALVAGIAGWIGMTLSGTVVGALGLSAGVVAAAVLARRRVIVDGRQLARLAAVVVSVVAGVVLLRGGDLDQFLRFVGVKTSERETTENVQSYSQRSVLAYIGLRIVRDHPVLGVGWQASGDEIGYGPYVDDARRRFPDVADEAFPEPGREWGVQNAYIQAAADLGVAGLVLWVALLASPLVIAWRAGRAALEERLGVAVAVAALSVTVAGIWVAQGLVAGAPLGAVTWLALGLAVWAAGGRQEGG